MTEASVDRAPDSPSARVVATAVIIAATGLLACVVALIVGGGAKVIIVAGLPNPGSGTIWGAPLATLLNEVMAIVTIGCLLGATWLIPSRTGHLGRTSRSLMVLASGTAVVWLIATIVTAIFTLSDILGQRATDVIDPTILRSFISQIEIGQTTVVQLIVIAICAVSSALITHRGSALYILVLAVCAVAIPAFTGHSATLGHHSFAIASLWFHIVTVSLWIGGLAVTLALAWIRQRDWLTVVVRFSTIALICYIIVALSGVANAATRLTSLSELFSTWYGRIVLDKVIVLFLLGWFGLHWRKKVIPKLTEPRAFTSLAVLEVALMGVGLGLGTALARTSPPVSHLGGESNVPSIPPDWTNILTFHADWVLFIGVVVAAVGYGWGLYRLSQRGIHWPFGRTFSWYLGLILVGYITSSGFATYGIYLFSVHMAQHMFLAMVAPLFLVLGSPVTLALEVLPEEGSSQAADVRRLLLDVLGSRITRFLLHPLFVLFFFAISTYLIYFSGLFSIAMANHLGHTLMLLHFLIAGLLFYIVVVGIDPIPNRPGAPLRIGMLVATMPIHAAFGVTVLSAHHILGAAYFRGLGLPWAVNLRHDQGVGGGLAWVFGEIPFVIVLGVVFVQWIRSEDDEAAAVDEAAGSGDEDDQLAAYNDYLAELNRRSGGR